MTLELTEDEALALRALLYDLKHRFNGVNATDEQYAELAKLTVILRKLQAPRKSTANSRLSK